MPTIKFNNYLVNLKLKNTHARNKTKDRIATNQTKFLSFPKPNGIGPIKPPIATFVLEVPCLALIKMPKKTIMNPITISNIPREIICSIFRGIQQFVYEKST